MKLLYERENSLLNRKRIAFEIDHPNSATPSREQLKKQIVENLKVDEKLISIRHIYSRFGENKSKVIVHVYKDEKDLKELEIKKGKKGEASEKPKTEEKPAQPVATPTEAPKEEPKVEEKKEEPKPKEEKK